MPHNKTTAFNQLKTAMTDQDTPPTLPVVRGMRRFVFGGTWNVDAFVQCWCGRRHTLNRFGWRVMFRELNRWLDEHEQCEAKL